MKNHFIHKAQLKQTQQSENPAILEVATQPWGRDSYLFSIVKGHIYYFKTFLNRHLINPK